MHYIVNTVHSTTDCIYVKNIIVKIFSWCRQVSWECFGVDNTITLHTMLSRSNFGARQIGFNKVD